MEREETESNTKDWHAHIGHNAAKNNFLDLKLCIMVIPQENTASIIKAKIKIKKKNC